jgi:uncharacterized protein (TIGR02246 family)
MRFHIVIVFALLSSCALAQTRDKSLVEIAAFNKELDRVTLAMDNAGVMSLWDEEGTTLLPGMNAVSGKQNIAKWLDGIVSKMPGYRVTNQKTDFHDIQSSGNWASEWGETHQVVQPPDGKAAIETHGKILLVLHCGSDGKWKIKQEMWNSGS